MKGREGDNVLDVLEHESLRGGMVGGEAGAVVVEVRYQVLPKHGHAVFVRGGIMRQLIIYGQQVTQWA